MTRKDIKCPHCDNENVELEHVGYNLVGHEIHQCSCGCRFAVVVVERIDGIYVCK